VRIGTFAPDDGDVGGSMTGTVPRDDRWEGANLGWISLPLLSSCRTMAPTKPYGQPCELLLAFCGY
jgi:hypothetical protein